jgi:hypothetical protein
MKPWITGLALVVVLAPSFHAAVADEGDSDFNRLIAARSLKCVFGKGSHGDWKRDAGLWPRLAAGLGQLLGTKHDGVTVKHSRFDATVHFDSIDHKAKTARLIGNQGSGESRIVTTASGVTFIEETGFGNLMFTTVFPALNNERAFIAVTSRHLLTLGGPFPSQYHGICEVWQ